MVLPPIATGIAGLDEVMNGGWPAGQLCLVQGDPGAGKTTLGLQFLLSDGADDRTLYVSLSETSEEISAVAEAHGWSLDRVEVFSLDTAETALGLDDQQTMFDPSDIEFRETSRAIMSEIERVKPTRMVFDSLSDLALLARDELSFRRELLRFKRLILRLKTTTLLMSDRTQPRADRHIHSLAHGVVELDERAPDYGTPKRRLRVRKLRGTDFAGGYHDFRILRGGLEVYPRLVAADQRALPPNEPLPTNLDNLDAMLGGGLARGASTLLMGPAGSGKSSLVALFARAALDVGDPAAAFLFDEESDLFLRRAAALGVSLDGYLESGQFELLQIDPGQISAGHFVHEVRRQITERGVRFIAIDSLNGYIHAMPDERFLVLQVHELLSYLARLGVATVLVLTQAGLVGSVTTPADITYVADAVMLTRFFEARGEVRRAVSMFKKRGGAHESTIRELRFDDGIDIGRVLTEFHGVLTGAPQFAGEHHELLGIDPRSSSD